MSNNKQNSVEWLFERITLFCMFTDGIPDEWSEALEQAKEMHKNETMDSAMDMFNHLNNLPYGIDYLCNRDAAQGRAEQYYNETYGE